MRILRLIAFLFLVCAVTVGAADWVRHSQHGGPMFRSMIDWSQAIAPDAFDTLQGFVETKLGADVWGALVLPALSGPAVLILAAASILVFMFVGFLRTF